MPKPFIILGSPFQRSISQFLKKNITQFKKLGYTRLLLDLSITKTPRETKRQLRKILEQPTRCIPLPYFRAILELLTLLETLEAYHFSYKFIDPETEEGAHRSLLKQSTQEELEVRDRTMAKSIIHEAISCQGGVLYFGSYEQQGLVRLLNAYQPEFYRFSIFLKQPIDEPLPCALISLQEEEKTRVKFYGTRVHAIDSLLFDEVAAKAQLLDSPACEVDEERRLCP